jgi:hypothetical protein
MEADAYERLLAFGVDCVPYCYGWVKLPPDILHSETSTSSSSSKSSEDKKEPPRWMLFEYVDSAVPLHDIALPMLPSRAHRVLDGLTKINMAGVLHLDRYGSKKHTCGPGWKDGLGGLRS